MGFFDLHEPEDGKDRFFLYAMIILPFIGTGSYVFDAWYYYIHYSEHKRNYCGLLSTIVIIFSYLQYSAPIRSRRARALYHILLWLLNEAAIIGYLCSSVAQHATFKIIIYVCFFFIEIYFTLGLLYCRVYKDFESNIIVENKHLFHFISRLDVILTIFIPMYLNYNYESFTRNTIAYFLLFDFFSDSYSRFQGVWIKSTLYLFVTSVTLAVALEWFYFNDHQHVYEEISFIAEILSAFLCDTMIILQFFPFHFKTRYTIGIARQALDFQKDLQSNIQTNMTMITNEINTVIVNNITSTDENIQINAQLPI
ncbi:hypothetical protein I4U23_016899 [Adineta vaga]|nr:hypothetical protein I4U23_016899 [Adineta vaga]